MNDIDFLEHGGGHFCVIHRGVTIPLPSPRERHFQWVLAALQHEHVPGTPPDVSEWKRALVFDRWRAAWDLPDFLNAQRLAYLVDKYRAPIAHDLQVVARLDLGELWRARRWVKILDVLDRLPAHSWYSASVSMDEEHAKMIADSIMAQVEATGEKPKEKGPALTSWSPEVAAITTLTDAVNGVRYAVIASASGGKAGEPPKPLARPRTPLETALALAEHRRRKAKHEALAARLLPHKRQSQTPVH